MPRCQIQTRQVRSNLDLAGHDHTGAPEISQFWFNRGIEHLSSGVVMRNSVLILLVLSAWGAAYGEGSVPAHPHVRVETTQGTFVLELEAKRAPLTVRNFLSLVDSGHYDGTIFQRVIPGLGGSGSGSGAWRSLVAHLLWEQRVGGSNPSAPTSNRVRRVFL